MKADSKNFFTSPFKRIRDSEYAYTSLLALVIGILAALGSISFTYMIEGFQWLFYGPGDALVSIVAEMPWYQKVAMPALGGLIVGPLIYYFAKEAKGHGVPEVMRAVALRGGIIRKRVVAIKALASAISIGSGSSVGSEGPIVQMGSALGSAVGQTQRLSGNKMKSLVACGAAGGIAAIFNAPIAGVMFAIEIIMGDIAISTFGPIIISAVTATVISRAWWGDIPTFHVPEYQLVSTWEIPAYILLGFIAAFVAIVFTKTLYWSEDFFEDKVKIPEYLQPVIGGGLVGITGLFLPHILGVGYSVIDDALLGNLPFTLLLLLIVIKIITTSISLGSGSSGGVFAPSLFIGAVTGGAFGSLAHGIFPSISATSGAYALVGMGAVVAGTTFAPITAIMIIFEMTSDYQIILPLMLTCITSTVVASSFSKESIYTMKLVREGINLYAGKEVNLLKSIPVEEAMARGVQTIPENMSIRGLNKFLEKSKHANFPLVDKNGLLSGIISFQDFKSAVFEEELQDLVVVKELAEKNVITVTPDENLDDALKKIGNRNIEQLPVVSKENPRKIVGILSRRDVISAYNKKLLEHRLRDSGEA